MIHQVLGGFQGQGSDIQIHAKETQRVSDALNDILSHHTKRPVAEIERDTNRDNFMSAAEAQAYGLIDSVLTTRGEAASG